MPWTQPPELRNSPPRQVKLTGIGIFLLVLGVVMLIGGIVLGVTVARDSAEQTKTTQALEGGEETDATVTRVWRSGKRSRTYRVGYQFENGGRIFRGDARISRQLWGTLSEGSKLRVRYAPADPMMNRPAE